MIKTCLVIMHFFWAFSEHLLTVNGRQQDGIHTKALFFDHLKIKFH